MAVTIDIDSLRLYRAIHGLLPTDEMEDPIYTRAVPRFFELIGELGIPATLFLVGQDAPRYAELFMAVRTTGSEIANHSFAHDYRMARWSSEAIREDLVRAHRALTPLTPDRQIRGFRAPGYNASSALQAAADELGYCYDSSYLPSPLYFIARATTIGVYAIFGRPSRSSIGIWKAFTGPLAPFRIGNLLELPISCEPFSRIPLIGTTLPMMPKKLRQTLVSSAIRTLPYFIFEMHAIDLLDASEVSGDLVAVQPDLRIPLSKKRRIFRDLINQLMRECPAMTLTDISRLERS